MQIPTVNRRPSHALALAAALILCAFAGTGCASTPSAEAEDAYHNALAKSAGDTMGAIKICEEGLTSYPSFTKMRFLLARLQYDTGEVQHLEERRAFAAARHAEEDGKTPGDVQKFEREAQDRHQKALPFYRACRENLRLVVSKEEDTIRLAWAYQLLTKCDVFFDDYKTAIEDLEKAIEVGKPQGEKLIEWQGLLGDLKSAAGGKNKPTNY